MFFVGKDTNIREGRDKASNPENIRGGRDEASNSGRLAHYFVVLTGRP